MEEHKRILESLSSNNCPSEVDGKTFPGIEVFKELYNRGYIDAVNVTTDDRVAFLSPKITLAGREHLSELKSAINSEPAYKSKAMKIVGWIFEHVIVVITGLIVVVLSAWLGLN